MRTPLHRLLAGGALALVGAALASTAACGTDAVGVDACRRIERVRCQVAPACLADFTSDDVTSCQELYRDECLYGIENAKHSPGEAEIEACIDALHAAAGCKQSGVKDLAGCTGLALASGVDGSTDVCAPIVKSPESLAACAFVETPPSSSTATSGSGGSGGGS